jgi:hypothetical protein
MEHQKHHYASDGHVEPDWKGETSNALVHSEPTGERQKECHQNKRKGEDGKRDVRAQNDKIQRAVRNTHRVTGLAMERMIGYVADEE